MGRWGRTGFCGRKGIDISVLEKLVIQGKMSQRQWCIQVWGSENGPDWTLNHLDSLCIVSQSHSVMSDSCPTPWIVGHQAPLSIEFSRQEHWSVCRCLLWGIFPTQGSNPVLLHFRPICYHLSHQGSPKWKPLSHVQLFVTPWTIQSMEFSRPEYYSG